MTLFDADTDLLRRLPRVNLLVATQDPLRDDFFVLFCFAGLSDTREIVFSKQKHLTKK